MTGNFSIGNNLSLSSANFRDEKNNGWAEDRDAGRRDAQVIRSAPVRDHLETLENLETLESLDGSGSGALNRPILFVGGTPSGTSSKLGTWFAADSIRRVGP